MHSGGGEASLPNAISVSVLRAVSQMCHTGHLFKDRSSSSPSQDFTGRNGSLVTLPTVFSSACLFGLLLLEAGASTAGQLQMLQRFLELKICFLSLPPTGLCSASWDHIECLFLFFLSIFEDGYHIVPKPILVKTHILSVSTIPSVKLFPDLLSSWPHNSEYSLVYQSSC